jgi:hypothetical protein
MLAVPLQGLGTHWKRARMENAGGLTNGNVDKFQILKNA